MFFKWALIAAAVCGVTAGAAGDWTPTWSAVAVAIGLAIVIVVAYRSYRPSYEYLRDRQVDPQYWSRIHSADRLPLVVDVLNTIRDAFLLRKADIGRLRGPDRLLDIYHAAYPSQWGGDAMEFETLLAELKDKFHVPESELTSLPEFTVDQVIETCVVRRGRNGP